MARKSRSKRGSISPVFVDVVLAFSAVAIIVDVANAMSHGRLFGQPGLSGLIISLITSLILYLLIDNSFRQAEQRRDDQQKRRFRLFFGDESIRFVALLLDQLHTNLEQSILKAVDDGRIRYPSAAARRARALFVSNLQTTIQNLPYFVENLEDSVVTGAIEKYFNTISRNELSASSTSQDLWQWVAQCDEILKMLDSHVARTYPGAVSDLIAWEDETRTKLAEKVHQKFAPQTSQTLGAARDSLDEPCVVRAA